MYLRVSYGEQINKISQAIGFSLRMVFGQPWAKVKTLVCSCGCSEGAKIIPSVDLKVFSFLSNGLWATLGHQES